MSLADELNLNLYEDYAENMTDVTLGRAAPSAAPSPRQRGPRTLPIGLRGRLPSKLAIPRRESLLPTDPSKYFTNKLMDPTFNWSAVGTGKVILAVVG